MIDRPANEPTDEIEVTPEMIGAATLALMPFYMGEGAYDLREPCLTAVYRAMHETAAKSVKPTLQILHQSG
jgi:hypothetical protein